MGSRIVFQGMVLVCSPCPHGCSEKVSISLPDGERVRNGECPNCKGKVHTFCFDNVIREGHRE